MGNDDVVVRGREAFERRDWLTAYEGLSAAGSGALRAADFADLATAAYLLCRHDDCVAAMQRAHQTYLAGGDLEPAVRTAFWLSVVLRQNGEFAVANGWIARAERLAEDLPEASVERGYLEFARLMRDVLSGDHAAAADRAERVVEVGRRFGDANLVGCGLMSRGRRAIYSGDLVGGFGFLDEAMVSVIAGEMSPLLAGMVLCSSIEACQELGEFGRVAQWTHALDAWCADQRGLEMFTGTCSLHKGQVAAMHGDLAGAVVEFEESIERFKHGGRPRPLGCAYAELGDVLRVQGRHAEAAEALRLASESGWDPVPQQAALDLACGRRADAAAAGRRMLSRAGTPIHRAQKLVSVVDLLLGDGDVDGAADVVRELSTVVARLGTVQLRAHAARAEGAWALAASDPARAEVSLRHAIDLFLESGHAYAAARARLLLADALAALGGHAESSRQADIGRTALMAMGAAVPAAVLARTDVGGLTERQLEVLRLVAAGQSNRDIGRDLHLSEKTVARHLSNIFLKLDVQSRTAAAAYAFAHGVAN
ncbi:hypothetical protein Back2_00140 [Nocardioides baekrokdamisoli]|uniref:HTH luxR-type domain-containing protein n=1 Tax=Nocardioides baekrokdamisoli TaxID=1804624 RepID=A0A3G9IAG7_9ACTN|nr:helix-turn-helix transcriptional regulator [Nocardioides baekrokdamisoli]BBH15727.1 hypothetical protein Back2_00140 [Nocardioides baekrokdamisoli]